MQLDKPISSIQCGCCIRMRQKKLLARYNYNYNHKTNTYETAKSYCSPCLKNKNLCSSKMYKKKKNTCNLGKKARLAVFVIIAQIVAFSSSASGLFSNYIVDHGFDIPIFQGLFVYIILCFLWCFPSTRHLGKGKNIGGGAVDLSLENTDGVSDLVVASANTTAQNSAQDPKIANSKDKDLADGDNCHEDEKSASDEKNRVNKNGNGDIIESDVFSSNLNDASIVMKFNNNNNNNRIQRSNIDGPLIGDIEKTINETHASRQLPGKMYFGDDYDYDGDSENNPINVGGGNNNEIVYGNVMNDEVSMSNNSATDQQTPTTKFADSAKDTVKIKYAILPGDYILLFLAAGFDTLGNVCAVKAYRYTTVASAQLLQCLNTPITFFSCWLFYSLGRCVKCSKATKWFRVTFTKPVLSEILSTMLAFIGTIVFSCLDSLLTKTEGDDNKTELDRAIGDILAMLAGFGYGMATTINEALMNRYTSIQYLARIAPINVVLLVILAFSIELDHIMKIDGYVAGMIAGFTVVIILLYFGGVYTVEKTSGLFYTLNMLTSNIYGFIFSIFVFNQKFNVYIIIGIVIILAGLFWYIFANNKKERADRLKAASHTNSGTSTCYKKHRRSKNKDQNKVGKSNNDPSISDKIIINGNNNIITGNLNGNEDEEGAIPRASNNSMKQAPAKKAVRRKSSKFGMQEVLGYRIEDTEIYTQNIIVDKEQEKSPKEDAARSRLISLEIEDNSANEQKVNSSDAFPKNELELGNMTESH